MVKQTAHGDFTGEGDIIVKTDNDRVLFGTGEDASIYYDGTNLNIDTLNRPRENYPTTRGHPLLRPDKWCAANGELVVRLNLSRCKGLQPIPAANVSQQLHIGGPAQAAGAQAVARRLGVRWPTK